MAARKIPEGRAALTMKIRTSTMTIDSSGEMAEDVVLAFWRVGLGSWTAEQRDAVDNLIRAFTPKKEIS